MSYEPKDIAIASSPNAERLPSIWIIVSDPDDGTTVQHFFSEHERDDWALNWCKGFWKEHMGIMPKQWPDAYEIVYDHVDAWMQCDEPIEYPHDGSSGIIDARKAATLLAALRLWQRIGLFLNVPERDIASNAGTLEPLTMSEINSICYALGGCK